MNDNHASPVDDARLLAAMQAVNPSTEKLMADRLALRRDLERARCELTDTRARANDLSQYRDVLIPRYIAAAKIGTLMVATIALMGIAAALFTSLLELKLTASLFASLMLPLWLVDMAERKFGRWELQRSARFRFASRSGLA